MRESATRPNVITRSYVDSNFEVYYGTETLSSGGMQLQATVDHLTRINEFGVPSLFILFGAGHNTF